MQRKGDKKKRKNEEKPSQGVKGNFLVLTQPSLLFFFLQPNMENLDVNLCAFNAMIPVLVL